VRQSPDPLSLIARRRNSFIDKIDKDAAIVDAQLQILRAREADFQKILDDMQPLHIAVISITGTSPNSHSLLFHCPVDIASNKIF
jgi:hypothetical protein